MNHNSDKIKIKKHHWMFNDVCIDCGVMKKISPAVSHCIISGVKTEYFVNGVWTTERPECV